MNDNRAPWLILLGLLLSFSPTSADAASVLEGFTDPTDGQFDTSDWLINHHGALPVPIIVTEPALGYGGGAALLFFHKKQPLEGEEGSSEDGPKYVPPSVTAAFGFATETQSWAGGGQHLGIWKSDSIRTLTVGAYTSVNLKFYPMETATELNLAGYIINQEVEFRIGASDFLLGGRYRYTQIDVEPTDSDSPIPGEKNTAIGGIGFIAHWDTRDSIFTPSTGRDFTIGADFNTPGFGSDTTWWELDYNLHSYHELHKRVVLGLRFDGAAVWGDAPFFTLPYVDLRGIPALRYQGEQAGEGEFEIRWRVYKRWSLIGFFGLGWTASSADGDSGPFPAGGGGFRYLIARKLSMQVGLDVARGPEDTAFYIQVGSAW
jgi:hypothetical protein